MFLVRDRVRVRVRVSVRGTVSVPLPNTVRDSMTGGNLIYFVYLFIFDLFLF